MRLRVHLLSAGTPLLIHFNVNFVHPCNYATLHEVGWPGLSDPLHDAVLYGAVDSATIDVFPYNFPQLNPYGEFDCGPQTVTIVSNEGPSDPCEVPDLPLNANP